MNKKNIFEGCEQILLSPRPLNKMGNLRTVFKNADSQWEQILKCHLESWQGTPINIISPSMFHLNDDISSKQDFENSKTIGVFLLRVFVRKH
jgi:hypothetical protein